jgi:hypothetical protein
MGAAHRQHIAQGELRDRSRLVEKLRGGGLQRPGSTLEAEWACTGIGMPAAARLSTGGGDRIREPGRAGGGLRHDRAPAATRILAHTSTLSGALVLGGEDLLADALDNLARSNCPVMQ